MISDDKSYYRLRANTEVERAQQATHPCAVAAHYHRAEAYREKLTTLEQSKTEFS